MATSGTSSAARRTARARAAGVVCSATAWMAPSSRTTHAYEPRSWIQYTISVVARRLANETSAGLSSAARARALS